MANQNPPKDQNSGMQMSFTPDTVVYDAIKADPDTIDRLIAISPTFRRLRNPVLRRVMGRLVTFRDAARIGGVTLEALLTAVNQAAWIGEQGEDTAGPMDDTEAPDWLARLEGAKQRKYDARPTLAKGKEPFGAIMRHAAKVRDGGFFILDTPFEPTPLRRVLARKGFVGWGQELAADHWRTWFLKDAALAPATPADGESPQEGGAQIWQEGDETHIDVRGLEPPQPMRAIIREIERPDGPAALTVHHEREPVFLYPELAERGWRHKLVDIDSDGEPGEVRLRLWRADPSPADGEPGT
jgi:hypothetical protein